MKAIQTGIMFRIFDDSIKSHDKLPNATFDLSFDQKNGCHLILRNDLRVDEKAYGVHTKKLDKVMRSFEISERSLGVILSGDKGIGKSMFAKMICQRAVSEGHPVIIVDACYPGLARFIASIEQECVVLFDEFDKIFRMTDDKDDQAELLSLFDGTSAGKKLYIVTCNELYSLNSYIINRPGRFHYHFRFDYPSPEDVRSYLNDKLGGSYTTEIDKVVEFSRKIDLNYDCLRSIVFELAQGSDFSSAIKDLNIMSTESDVYDVYLYLENGKRLEHTQYNTNLYDSSYDGLMIGIVFYDENGDYALKCYYDPKYAKYDIRHSSIIIPAKGIKMPKNNPDDDSDNPYAKAKPAYISFKKRARRNYHFAL